MNTDEGRWLEGLDEGQWLEGIEEPLASPTHDPLCYVSTKPELSDLLGKFCDCDLIARVRGDERDAVVERVEALRYATGAGSPTFNPTPPTFDQIIAVITCVEE